MNIQRKLFLSIVLTSVAAVIVTALLIAKQAKYISSKSLENITENRLTAILDAKADQLRMYFDNVGDHIHLISNDVHVVNAMKELQQPFTTYIDEFTTNNKTYKTAIVKHYLHDFTERYQKYNVNTPFDPKSLLNVISENSFALQYEYILNNPYGLTNKSKLDEAKDGSKYSSLHAKYHPQLRKLKKKFEFYDLFLVDLAGNIIYTVEKELDFTTSLLNGPYANTHLGQVFRKANSATDPGYIAFADFAPYLASYDNQAAFVATPIFDHNGQKQGVLVGQLAVDDVTGIMTNQGKWQHTGFGDTMSAFIVGQDYKLRSQSRLFTENPKQYLQKLQSQGFNQKILELMAAKNSTIGLLPVRTKPVVAALNGNSGFASYNDYLNVPVLGAYEPLHILGLNWAIVVELEKSEAFMLLKQLEQDIITDGILITIAIALIAVFIATMVAAKISKPIDKITKLISDLSVSKDLTKRLPVIGGGEIASMVKSFNKFIASLQASLQNTSNYTSKVQERVAQLPLDEAAKDDIGELTNKIDSLSNQFKLLEDDADDTKEW